MSTEPLVSVILPTRNRSALLQRAVASVLSQTYRKLELIVVNDASTDDTREVLAAIGDPRLRVIHRERNHGAAAARNAGMAAAIGELFAFQDDDDCWLVQKLEKQVQALQAAPADVGWCLGGYIAVDGAQCFYVGGSVYFDKMDYRRGNGLNRAEFRIIATPNWLVRREALQRAGPFDERLRSWDDWELGLRLEQVTRRIHVDEPLFIQNHAGGMMRAERAQGADLRYIMERHGGLWAGNRTVQARHWYIIGRTASVYDAAPAGRVELRRALRLNPLRPKTWAALAASYLNRDFHARLTSGIRRVKTMFS